jgi:hypothetical protein
MPSYSPGLLGWWGVRNRTTSAHTEDEGGPEDAHYYSRIYFVL